jgi:polyisoprenoid-binding protein YceI
MFHAGTGAARVLTAGAAMCLLPFAQAHAEQYKLDKQHTEVRVSWGHLGLSRQSARFMDVDGTVEFDPERPDASRVAVTIKVASVVTGSKELDNLLTRTRDYFDAANHPAITFVSTQVRPLSDRTAQVVGDLTINGISKAVVLDVVWNFTGEHPLAKINPAYTDVQASGFSAQTQIFRSDWGLTRTIPFVSDELRIEIEAEALKQPLAASR